LHTWLRTWQREVDAFVVLTEHQRRLFERGGLPNDRIHVKPNFYAQEGTVQPWQGRGVHAIYAGRIAQEKGVDVLVRAWLDWGPAAPHLRILGDGPLREPLARTVAQAASRNIEFLGARPRSETLGEIGRASLLLLPSVGMEGLPMVIPEAFALGTPVAASDAGPLPSLIDAGNNGVLFKAGDHQSLRFAVASAWNERGRLELMGEAALQTYLDQYTPARNLTRLMQIYELAKEGRRQAG